MGSDLLLAGVRRATSASHRLGLLGLLFLLRCIGPTDDSGTVPHHFCPPDPLLRRAGRGVCDLLLFARPAHTRQWEQWLPTDRLLLLASRWVRGKLLSTGPALTGLASQQLLTDLLLLAASQEVRGTLLPTGPAHTGHTSQLTIAIGSTFPWLLFQLSNLLQLENFLLELSALGLLGFNCALGSPDFITPFPDFLTQQPSPETLTKGF